jgi:light-regulated signal transduction histidine kinase (bacteriophytochrome)
VELEELVRQTIDDLRPDYAGRTIDFSIGALGPVQADPVLLRHAMANLLGNAVKYTRNNPAARIQVGRLPGARPGAPEVYFVKDNGAGFDMRYSSKLFGVFQRLHGEHEYEGTGVGLAIVQRVISRHGGRIWADARLGEGATFYFTLLPEREEPAGRADESETPAQPVRHGSGQHH